MIINKGKTFGENGEKCIKKKKRQREAHRENGEKNKSGIGDWRITGKDVHAWDTTLIRRRIAELSFKWENIKRKEGESRMKGEERTAIIRDERRARERAIRN